jgi:hypothetical protein
MRLDRPVEKQLPAACRIMFRVPRGWGFNMVAAIQVPDAPVDGRHQHTDGRVYVLRSYARAMGFTPPFLLKYRTASHPCLGRKLLTIRKRLRFARRGGRVVVYNLRLYLIEDLEKILEARRAAKAPRSGDWPTLAEAARRSGKTPAALVGRAERGKLTIRTDRVARTVRQKGRSTVQFVKVRRVCPDNLKPSAPDDPDWVPFPRAEEFSGISLHTWHSWRRNGCPLIGRKPKTSERETFTAHGHGRELIHVHRADYDAIVALHEQANAGRIVRDGAVYLAPPAVAREFALPTGQASPTMLLANRRHTGKLAGPDDSIDGHYFNEAGKLIHGKCYREEGVESLGWPRVRPRAPKPIAHSPAPKSVPMCSGYTVEIDDGDRSQVRVAGRAVPVSFGTFSLLRELAIAREKGEGVELRRLQRIDSNPYQTLRRFEKKCPIGSKPLDFPGGKAKGGYRLN